MDWPWPELQDQKSVVATATELVSWIERKRAAISEECGSVVDSCMEELRMNLVNKVTTFKLYDYVFLISLSTFRCLHPY